MSTKFFFYLSLLCLIVMNTATAGFYRGEYRLGLFKDGNFDPAKITHVIVVGSAAKEDSNQFFQSGMSRAQRYKELWPDHQVVFLYSPEVRDT